MQNKTKYGVNSNTYDQLFNSQKLPKEQWGSKDNFNIWSTLDAYTQLEHKNIFIKILKIYFSPINLNYITFNDLTKQYEYNDGKNLITFDMLSNYIKYEDFVKELKSNKRYHKCHERALQMGHQLKGSYIVTGFITQINERKIHSIVEITENDITYIYDWSTNLRMEKENYYKLMKFEEIQRIESNTVEQELKLMSNIELPSIKTYLTCRDEIIADLEKNMDIFSEEDQEVIKQAKR